MNKTKNYCFSSSWGLQEFAECFAEELKRLAGESVRVGDPKETYDYGDQCYTICFKNVLTLEQKLILVGFYDDFKKVWVGYVGSTMQAGLFDFDEKTMAGWAANVKVRDGKMSMALSDFNDLAKEIIKGFSPK